MEQFSDGPDDVLDVSMIEPSEWVEASVEEEMGQYQFDDELQNADQCFNSNY